MPEIDLAWVFRLAIPEASAWAPVTGWDFCWTLIEDKLEASTIKKFWRTYTMTRSGVEGCTDRAFVRAASRAKRTFEERRTSP